jgi:hypothetical protein
MSQGRSFSRGASSYKRSKQGKTSTGKIFLIVTEGEKTEPNYLKAIRDRLKLSTVDVEIIHPNQFDPLSLTQKAIKLRDERRKEARKDKSKLPYDEVWVVFDLESQNSSYRKKTLEAKKLNTAAGINFAISDPSFEFWLLLHEEYTTAPFADSNQVETRLKSKANLPDYSKGGWLPTPEFIEKLPTAVKNAKRCRGYHKTANGDGNPSTDVDYLVISLNGATRRHYQFDLSEISQKKI